ncbi:glycoside hydrolase family 5 protein [Streptomyces sp. P38-E01]|uniref:cellulase n=1 Tax=Streptomyces tardus TaxID=2780544 RepID=A0A949JMX2_9ACTN|nr:glycoside hydrolase family 5 protein [Streptomyces tardus]MBU7598051.1 glycoside hydrolase family 5 protein [Streptomyces tardus]
MRSSLPPRRPDAVADAGSDTARPHRRSRSLGALLGAAALLAAGTSAGLAAAAGADTPATGKPAGPAPAAAEEGTAFAEHGRLEVCGTKLCGEDGRPVQLRGMSTHGTQWYSQCVTDGSLDALADDWGADVLRVSTYVQEGGYETDPEGFTDLASRIIDQATERGMYVVVDWHQLTPGDPNHNTERAKKFFTDITARHGDQNNLIYEIANEPNGVGWSGIRSYAEEVIPAVRAGDPDGVVLVGTRAWSSLGLSEGADEQEIVNDPVDADNIMYTFHFYAASHGDSYLSALDRASDQLPIFVTEFGTQDHAGEDANDFDMSQRYLDLMEQKNISWINWNFSDDHRSGAVFKEGTCNAGGPWAGPEVLKEAGVWIRDRMS